MVKQIKRRYLSFLIESKNSFKKSQVFNVIQNGVLHLYGLKGLISIDPVLIDYDESNEKGIIRCDHKYIRQMRASIASISEIDGSSVAFRVIKVSGTIKSLKEIK